MAINTLAGMGILTDDDGLVDAALSEVLSLPVDQRHERDPERDVTYLLIQHHLGQVCPYACHSPPTTIWCSHNFSQGDPKQALSVSQKAVFAEPERTDVRRELASLTLRNGESAAALAILGGSAQTQSDFSELRASLALHAVVESVEAQEDAQSDALRLAQKAVKLTPWDKRAWEASTLR